ncbi:MAG: glycosyltransferase, partial [Clostridia bacterium]|nr:glycosyltransferase [Clostridia bacterium]
MSVSKKRHSVLLLTNSFSTGGVETHILSLAKGLLARGFFVAVASAGGSLEKELEKLNIPHIYLPLDVRSFYNIFLARRLLLEAVKEYRFDIVHAHSRLAAFVVSLLPKSLRRHFVTTAHLDFKITPLTRFFSRWGEKTLAVSEDIRAYLVREYCLSYRQISLTVNGIDTDR